MPIFDTTPMRLGLRGARPAKVKTPPAKVVSRTPRSPKVEKYTPYMTVRIFPQRPGVYGLRSPDGKRTKMRWDSHRRVWCEGRKAHRPEDLRGWRWRGFTESWVTAHNLKPPTTAPLNQAAQWLQDLAERFQLTQEAF